MASPKATSAEKLLAGSLADFSGGPNLRDSASELAANELEDAWNVTLDERGGAASRLGFIKRNAAVLGTGERVINDTWSRLLSKWVTQVGQHLFLNDAVVPVHTFTTNACVTFAETDNRIVVAHPVDGLWYSPDGTTWTKITSANAPTQPLCVASWEAKLFVGLADGSVHWSAAGDILTWNVNDFNPIWTIDQQPIVNLHVGSGQDIQGRPGLLAFKNESVYRINDPATGANTVVDATNGCGGPKAVVGVGARVCWIGKRGIFWWREDQAQPVSVSDLLEPLWRDDQINVSLQAGFCAGRRLNRAYFSLAYQHPAFFQACKQVEIVEFNTVATTIDEHEIVMPCAKPRREIRSSSLRRVRHSESTGSHPCPGSTSARSASRRAGKPISPHSVCISSRS